MTMRTIKGIVRGAILGGALSLLPAAASADEGANTGDARGDVPDHAQAEGRRGTEATPPATERTEGAPDHAEAEARGAPDAVMPAGQRPGVPDHAAVEKRDRDGTK
jgi:hypothetical protein